MPLSDYATYPPSTKPNFTLSLTIPSMDDPSTEPAAISELSTSSSSSNSSIIPPPTPLKEPKKSVPLDPAAENLLNYLKQCENIKKPIPICGQKWLAEMGLEPEMECMSVLYAKSVLSAINEQKKEPCRIQIG